MEKGKIFRCHSENTCSWFSWTVDIGESVYEWSVFCNGSKQELFSQSNLGLKQLCP